MTGRVRHQPDAAPTVPEPRSRRGRRSLRVASAIRLGHLAERASRASGLGAGGVIGGRVLLALAPGAVGELSAGRDLTLVSGTNGKTTTSAYVAAALGTLGPVVANADGANTRAGLARALASGTADRVVLETDEGWLPWLMGEAQGALPVLLNLTRDQLHRHHEVARVARTWHDALAGADHVVANADDPAVVYAALSARTRTWVAAGAHWTQDAVVCPRCGDECHREGAAWSCRCGLRRPRPQWWVDGDKLVHPAGRVRLELGLPGSVNGANAAMAAAAAARLGVPPEDAVAAMGAITTVAGRYAVFTTSTHRARLILAKNPASWAEALECVGESPGPVVLAFNSDGVDGRDPSWLYDVPFGDLAGRRLVVTGRRSTDMLVRLEMDELVDVAVAPDAAAALELLPPGEVTVIANYTAFQEARRVLGHAE